MQMEVYFPGNKKVHARHKGFVVETDQPAAAGGDNTAPSPFDLFLVSIGTCAGFFVVSFLQERGLPTEGAGVVMSYDYDKEAHLVTGVTLEIKLPEGFPDKYRAAIIRTVEQCTVKRHLDHPPAFEIHAAIA